MKLCLQGFKDPKSGLLRGTLPSPGAHLLSSPGHQPYLESSTDLRCLQQEDRPGLVAAGAPKVLTFV